MNMLQEGSRRRDREWDREGARDFDRARYIPARPQAPLHHDDQLHSPRPPRCLACCMLRFEEACCRRGHRVLRMCQL